MREIPPGGVRRSRTHHRPHVQGHESSHDGTRYHQIRTNKDKDKDKDVGSYQRPRPKRKKKTSLALLLRTSYYVRSRAGQALSTDSLDIHTVHLEGKCRLQF